jgi:hypothetical protein
MTSGFQKNRSTGMPWPCSPVLVSPVLRARFGRVSSESEASDPSSGWCLDFWTNQMLQLVLGDGCCLLLVD